MDNDLELFEREKKSNLGQFFTTNNLLQDVVESFIMNKTGIILEPSIGAGDLLGSIKKRKIIGVEIDDTVLTNQNLLDKNPLTKIYNGCFFKNSHLFKDIKTVISNPPYVKWNSFKKSEFMSLEALSFKNEVSMADNGNLAYLFMYRCIQLLEDFGEMIFLVPKDFTTSTSAFFLRKKLKDEGFITHWMEGREDKFFHDADLENLCIFRWQKGKRKRDNVTKYFHSAELVTCKQFEVRKESYFGESLILYLIPEQSECIIEKTIGDYFNIKVGSVSGKDDIFKNPPLLPSENILELYTSYNKKEKFLYVDNESILYPEEKEYLKSKKEILLKRHGANTNNYMEWSTIRNKNISINNTFNKILIQSKTRKKDPFFIGDESGFSGALYAFIPIDFDISQEDISYLVKILNSTLYSSILSSNGLGSPNKNGVKLKLIPKSLESLPIPKRENWKKYSISLNYSYD